MVRVIPSFLEEMLTGAEVVLNGPVEGHCVCREPVYMSLGERYM